MANYSGVIIEESLDNKEVLKKVKIIGTKTEQVTDKHKTPWVKQWTLHTIEVREGNGEKIADEISKSLDWKHYWYADFKNEKIHFIIFKDKVFKVDRKSREEYELAKISGFH